jgi:hypothetical protein
MSRRVGLRLVPGREADDLENRSDEVGKNSDERLDRQQTVHRAAPDDDQALPDQPPALGATPAATPSR